MSHTTLFQNFSVRELSNIFVYILLFFFAVPWEWGKSGQPENSSLRPSLLCDEQIPALQI